MPTRKDKNTVNRKNLIEALSNVLPGLANNTSLEVQASYFIFENDKIWTYNDQISICQQFKSNLIGAIKAKELYKLLNKIPDNVLKITQKDNAFFKIKGKSLSAKIRIDPDIKLQAISIPDRDSDKWQLLPDDFNMAVSVCLFSVSKNATPPELTCLWIADNFVFSTDGFRATQKEMAGKVKTDFLLPAIAAKELIKYNAYKVFTDIEGWLHFIDKDNDLTFSCRTFADLLYPKKIWDFFNITGAQIKLPADFNTVIDRISTFVAADFELDKFVDITIENNQLICEGKGVLGEVSETVDGIDYDGEKITVCVHPGLLIAVLKYLDSVVIGKRLLFKGKGFNHCICLSSSNND